MTAIETFRGVAFPWHCDQMGHLTTSRYVEMFDVAGYHLLHRIGLTACPEAAIGLADVRQEIDYKSEVPLGGLVVIQSSILKVGRSSLRARHNMTSVDGDLLHAVMEVVTVRFDLTERKSMPFPAEIATRAAALLPEGVQ